MTQPSSGADAPSRGAVILPCEPDQFSAFIAGLLGRPQTITRQIHGPFEVRRVDVENLHHLISQRLTSQNAATLVQFTARIVYDDNSSVLLNTFSDFQTYNEVRPLQSTAVHVSWTWLIKFPNKQIPEKQQIDVSFSSSLSNGDTVVLSGFPGRASFSASFAHMRIRIAHTDRTWGTDIETLLAGHLAMLRKPQTGYRALANDHAGKIGFAIAIIVFACAMAAAYNVTNSFVQSYLSSAQALSSNPATNFEQLAKKMDFVMTVIASGMWTRYAVYVTGLFVVSIVISLVCGITVSTYAETRRPSFVILTQKSEVTKAAELRSYENNWLIFLASFAGSITVSILGNYAFYKLMQLWAIGHP